MTHVARLPKADPTRAGHYLGPAAVTELLGRRVAVARSAGDRVEATLALAYLYEPVVGDELLVLGNDADGFYAIGVLHATGRAVLAIQGDVDVRAVGGKLRLQGDHGVAIAAPEVDVDAQKLRMTAESVVQRFENVYKRVRALLSVHAGKAHTVVDGATFTQAESGTIQTKEVMTINGKQIHLA